MSHILTIDLKNLLSNEDNYKVITFPNRIKILSMSFSVNGEARGSEPGLDRVWKLYAWGAHPTPQPESPWNEWSFPVFGPDQKPTLSTETANFYSTIETPASALFALPAGGGVLNLEVHQGVFAPNDYMALWVDLDSGDTEGITWEDTEATINIVYEETSMKTVYEQVQANPWLD